MRAPTALIGAALCAMGCGTSATGLSADEPLIATLRGHIVASLLSLPKNPRVGVLWTGVPVYVPYCHEYGYTPLDPERAVSGTAAFGCRNPFEVVPGVMGPSVKLELSATNGGFEIPLRQVPPASVMVGAPGARVAYGSVVVFNDDDANEDLTFPGRCGGGGRGPTASPASADAGLADDAGAMPNDRRANETIWGATFRSLTEHQVRVVYQEGAHDQSSFFYPTPTGCTVRPAPGFSIWEVDSLLDSSGGCTLRDISEPVSLAIVDDRYALGLRCVPSDRSTFAREFSSRTAENLRDDPRRYDFSCLDDGTIAVVDLSCSCREVRTYPLAGCRDEVDCPVPEWDLRANPPEWWPCPVRRGP